MDTNFNNYNLTTNIVFGTTLFGEEMTFNVQSVNLPGIGIAYSKANSRYDVLNPTIAYESLEFPALQVTFLSDEDMKIWMQFITLIVSSRDVDFFNNHHDAWIAIKTNNGKPVAKINYINIVVTNISDLTYDFGSDNTEQTFTVDIQYDYYEIENVMLIRDRAIAIDIMQSEIDKAVENRNVDGTMERSVSGTSGMTENGDLVVE
jgi:hypothetical protein